MTYNAQELKTETTRKRLGPTLLALTALWLFPPNVHAGSHELNRTRSIYVPLRFEACEHVRHVTFTVTGDPTVFTLGTRILMFTYYPERDAVLPDFAEVWIEGEATTDDGTRTIRTNLLVTPERIVSSRDLLDRGNDEIVKQLRRRRDVRLPETVVHIKCEDNCTRRSHTGTRSADTEAPDEPAGKTPIKGAPLQTMR